MTDSDRVLVAIDDHVAHVRMNRADKRNGLDLAQVDALIAAAGRLADDRRVRAVVLSGEGPAFCAGLDWASILAGGPDAARRLLDRPAGRAANLAQQVAWSWTELPVPVIAAVRGPAFGAGLQIALACDLRLCAADARFSAMEIRYGLIPDMSASRTLLRLVRDDVARELIYTGRIVEAAEAASLGLVTRLVDDPVADALALARQIAAAAPSAIRAAKRLCVETADLDARAALAHETALQLPLLGSPEQQEATAATMQKRAPRFPDPAA
ncbi:MAG TPA: crotonase/enoyl-CoA hydratase family protein [Kofleriaceae bacterium]|nr:crotonase/enoyl-CoA hydratase family protein [Kofleriaceae bacterium]